MDGSCKEGYPVPSKCEISCMIDRAMESLLTQSMIIKLCLGAVCKCFFPSMLLLYISIDLNFMK